MVRVSVILWGGELLWLVDEEAARALCRDAAGHALRMKQDTLVLRDAPDAEVAEFAQAKVVDQLVDGDWPDDPAAG